MLGVHISKTTGDAIEYHPGEDFNWIVPPRAILAIMNLAPEIKLYAGSMSNFDGVKALPWKAKLWLSAPWEVIEERLQSPNRTNPFGKNPQELEKARKGHNEHVPGMISIDATPSIAEVVKSVRKYFTAGTSSQTKRSDPNG